MDCVMHQTWNKYCDIPQQELRNWLWEQCTSQKSAEKDTNPLIILTFQREADWRKSLLILPQEQPRILKNTDIFDC